MRVRRTTACALVLGAAVAVSGRQRVWGDEMPGGATASDLAGRWTYDARLSDDARQKMREAMERRQPRERDPRGPDPGGPVGSLPDDQEAMRPILEPTEALTITQSEREVAIDETFGRSRTLRPDGKERKADNGTSEVKVRWKNGSLVVETRRDRGRKIVETWQRSVDGTRLTATYRIERPSGPALTLKRVYTLSPALRY